MGMAGSLGTLATSLAQLVDPRIQVKLGIGTLATSYAQLVDETGYENHGPDCSSHNTAQGTG